MPKTLIPLYDPLLDWVGYENVIDFIRQSNIQQLQGDFVEIGSLFGGGTRKLSKFLETEAPKKSSTWSIYLICPQIGR